MRSATRAGGFEHGEHVGFNPRTPCGVRPPGQRKETLKERFQSTHSLRSATRFARAGRYRHGVSIHALLAECDSSTGGQPPDNKSFNPRTPCGVRLPPHLQASPTTLFQSTHSLRSATPPDNKRNTKLKVSIHALLAECDATGRESETVSASFNPRTPCGVRPKN